MTNEERSATSRRGIPVEEPRRGTRRGPDGEGQGGLPPAGAAAPEAPTVQLRSPEELIRRRGARQGRGRRPDRGRKRRLRERGPAPGGAGAFLGGAVAAAYLALSLADGGFAPGVWALATVLVWWTALVSLLAAAWPRSRIPRPALAVGAALLGLAVLAALSLLWASDLGGAYEDAIRAAGYLGVFALATIAARAGGGRHLLAGLAVGLVGLAVLALLSRLEPGFVTGPDEARALEVSAGRLSYPLGYWNALGGAMAAAIPLLIWLGASAGTPRRRALATAAIPTCSLVLFFTASRGAALATAVGVCVLLAAGPRRVTLATITAASGWVGFVLATIAGLSPALVGGAQGSEAAARGDELLLATIGASLALGLVALRFDRRISRLHVPVLGTRRAAAGLAVVALLGLLLATPQIRAIDDPPSTFQAGVGENRFAAVGGSGRTHFWSTALDALAEQPARGVGAGGFESYWALEGPLELTVTHAHSFFLEAGAELGLGGLFLALAVVGVPAAAGVRRLRAPTAWADRDAASGIVGVALATLAVGAVAASLDWTWDVPSAFIPLVAAAAFLCAPAVDGRRRRRAPGEDGDPPPRRWGVAAAVLVVGLAAMGGAAALYLGQSAIEESRASAAQGRLGEATDEARAATELLPFAAEPYRRLALVQAERGRTRAALRAVGKAQERATADWNLWFVEAGIRFRGSDYAGGTWALARARALNPKAPPEVFGVPSRLERGSSARRLARKLADPDGDA